MSKKPVWVETARRGRNHSVLIIDEAAESFKTNRLSELIPGVKITFYRQFAGARWFDQDEGIKYVAALRKIADNHPERLLELAVDYSSLLNKRQAWSKKASKLNFRKMSNSELFKFSQYNFIQNVFFFVHTYTYIFLNKFYPDQLVAKINSFDLDLNRQNEVLSTLFALDKPSEIRLEKEAILEIARLIQSKKYALKSPEIEEMVKKHAKKFASLGLYYFWGRAYTPCQIRNRLKTLIKKDLSAEEADLERQKNVVSETEKIIKELKLGQETILQIRILKAWAYAANQFDEVYTHIVCDLWEFWKEVGRRFKLNYKEVVAMRGSELLNVLSKGVVSDEFKKEFEDRAEESALILSDGDIRVLSGDKLKRYYQEEEKAEELFENITELKGQSASPGKVIGKARVVFSVEDTKKVKRGEILVAASTVPSFVPAMERSAAIVTNEGGLLSHAAIVSRELGIPCVVGTKIATKILHDGDKLEVDASAGIVKIIR